jgi:hypothetical protein
MNKRTSKQEISEEAKKRAKNYMSLKGALEPKKEITMKGIYLTEKGKQEIEAKIAELDRLKREPDAILTFNEYQRIIDVYKEILALATILPVEKSWDDVESYPPDNQSQIEKTLRLKNGVIIQPKQ